ncbi:hypothetical protein EAH75_18030 [Rhodanobacter glycinis]|uniref:DUF4149 domain-containing protein n=1 Tax=Rhodanobacter glycinis TaxID=582702 RepID=UPI001127AD22|nr:DUF4149 domain-containing protein [Rhodanobacter glycinis]TPG45517.1 hypothetical protein EAH75_18030 [Rhodanobacter glycinis]
MSRSDPIRKEYFKAVELGDKVSDFLFYLGAFLSIVCLLVNQANFPAISSAVLIAFGVSALSLFVMGLVSRLYLTPRAQDKRLQEFFSSAWGISLIHQKTDGYYNNEFADPIKRMAAQVLENSHFSKAVSLRMARAERVRIILYVSLWLVCVLCRQTDLGVVVAASQAVFSEQLVSRWIRLEWLRVRFEKTFDDVYKLFQSQPPVDQFHAMAFEAVSLYETAKANAAITLSSKIFDDMNLSLSNEWDVIKAALRFQ